MSDVLLDQVLGRVRQLGHGQPGLHPLLPPDGAGLHAHSHPRAGHTLPGEVSIDSFNQIII